MYKSGNFNGKNRWIIKKATVFKKLLPHLATRGTYSPGDWRCDEAWREQTLVYPPVMCQQRLIYCTWELNVMGRTYSLYTGYFSCYYSDVTMSAMASQITGVSSVYSRVCSGANQIRHQSSVSLAFVRGIHRWPVNSPHKGSVTRKIFPFDDFIMHSACRRH